MSMFYRCFTITDEKDAAIQAVCDRIEQERTEAKARAERMAAEHEFGSPRWVNGRLCGFTMPEFADLWGLKEIGRDEEGVSVYRPKWNTALGRAIRKEFNAIRWPEPLDAILKECFPNAKGIMVIGGTAPRWGNYMHRASLEKMNGQWILKVPAYTKDSHEAGREHYTPDEGVTEISEADFLELKAAALRAEEAGDE